MSAALTENPAVLDPHGQLTPAQQDALCAIGFFRTARLCRGKWQIGNKRFTCKTIDSLRHQKLVVGYPAALTTAGQLAADRLKGKLQ